MSRLKEKEKQTNKPTKKLEPNQNQIQPAKPIKPAGLHFETA